MTIQAPITANTEAPRHARLFELIRQSNLAAMQMRQKAQRSQNADAQSFAQQARSSLSPQEQKTLGISESFGR